MNNLVYVKSRNRLKQLTDAKSLSDSIVERVKAINNYQTLKLDCELILFVCNCIENAVYNKVDKKSLALSIMKQIFVNVTPSEELVITDMIEFLFVNHLIKKVPMFTKVKRIVKSWLTKKLT